MPGAEMGNASPPSPALLALGLTQTCLALSLAGPARRLLRAGGPWTAVVGVSAVVLTLFLWHMSAAILAGVLLYGTGLLPQPPVGSAEWPLLRVPWVLGVGAVMVVLPALLGPVEARTGLRGRVAGRGVQGPQRGAERPHGRGLVCASRGVRGFRLVRTGGARDARGRGAAHRRVPVVPGGGGRAARGQAVGCTDTGRG